MKRNIYHSLKDWKHKKDRKPLILNGARQVGKTYILNEFGKNEYENYFHFDFDQDANKLVPLFGNSLSPKELLTNLSIFLEKKITADDLLIFDEIQNCPRALTSLKYFYDEMPGMNICAAGSLLGVTLSGESFPVGKVDMLHLCPMNFEEFLMAGNHEMLLDIFRNALVAKDIPPVAHEKLCEIMKQYYVVGGLPQAVKAFYDDNDLMSGMLQAREIQKNLIDGYGKDFNKHSGKINALHIQRVFKNIPSQLSQNIDHTLKRYRFKDVIPGKKGYHALEGPIDWLVKSGLVIKTHVCEKAAIPLQSFCKPNIFKLYLFDIGLLGAMLELSIRTIIIDNYGFTSGFFVENMVACELLASGVRNLYSWSERNSEMEFILACGSDVVPVEVKAGHRTKAKSLGQYMQKYRPVRAIKLSQNNLELGKGPIERIPLYLAGYLDKYLGQ
jgi:hypothetical protein